MHPHQDKEIQHTLTDTHQSVWQLTAIQLAGWTSLPILATSIFILQENSLLGAILTIIVGNAILWFIRLGIIAMSYANRQSTLDISRDYLGNKGSYFIAALLLISTQAWFITQTTAASTTLTRLISLHENPAIDQFTQMSVFLGILSSFLCMNGMVVIRKFTTYIFPVLITAFFVILFSLPDFSLKHNNHPLSLSGLGLVLATNLGITSDLPTFFRHSNSWGTSIKALTFIQLISLALGIVSLYFGSIINQHFEINEAFVNSSNANILRFSLIIFVFLSVICANIANVYSASVGWELVAPSALVGRKEYLILGLGLTTIFILVSNIFSLEFLLNVSDSSLVNLCLVLILGYIVRKRQEKLPNSFQQMTYFLAWLLSTIANTVQYSLSTHFILEPLEISFLIIILIFSTSFLVKWARPGDFP